jgi:O-acetyl-ADP-ribose deacetylase (regulator of RNase III)
MAGMEVQRKEGGGMIIYKTGDILTSEAEHLVNPTNFQGPMCGGLARKFANRFYGLEQAYCDLAGSERFGAKIRNYDIIPIWREFSGVRIVNFSTMDIGGQADLSEVTEGLVKLAPWIAKQAPTSIAFPKLGCGIGGLDWNDVKPVIEMYFGNIDGLTVEIWE